MRYHPTDRELRIAFWRYRDLIYLADRSDMTMGEAAYIFSYRWKEVWYEAFKAFGIIWLVEHTPFLKKRDWVIELEGAKPLDAVDDKNVKGD